MKKERVSLISPNMITGVVDTLKLRSKLQYVLEEMKVNSLAVNIFRELLFRPFWQHLNLLCTCVSRKREKGEMDTLTLEYFNLLVLGERFLQV